MGAPPATVRLARNSRPSSLVLEFPVLVTGAEVDRHEFDECHCDDDDDGGSRQAPPDVKAGPPPRPRGLEPP